MPFVTISGALVTGSVLLLVVMPGATSSVLATSCQKSRVALRPRIKHRQERWPLLLGDEPWDVGFRGSAEQCGTL